MSEHTDALNAMDGIPASVGFFEPIEGFRYRPHYAVKAMQEMASEITRLQSEVERLRGRCEELTEIVAMAETPCRAWYKQANDGGWQIYSAVQQAAKGNSGAWLLRKQAESAEQAAKELSTIPGAALWDCEEVQDWLARAYAKRLRQQAAEGSDEAKAPR